MPRLSEREPPRRPGYRSGNRHERIHPAAIIIFILLALVVFGYLVTARRHSMVDEVKQFKEQDPGDPLPGANNWSR